MRSSRTSHPVPVIQEPKYNNHKWHWHHTNVLPEVLDMLHNLDGYDKNGWINDGGVHNWWWKNLFETSSPKYGYKSKKSKPTRYLKTPAFNNMRKNELSV